MKHLSEEELIAQYYGEGDEFAAKSHLKECPECAKAYSALQSDLAEMKFAEPPDRDPFYGQKVWGSLSRSLCAYEAPRRNWLDGRVWRGLSYATVCLLLVASAFIGGRSWERRQSKHTASLQAQQQSVPVANVRRVVVVVLSDHLERSERLLVELKHADADSTELVSPLRDEAQSLLAANRVCRQNATQQDDPELSSALERLDHVLQELANEPGGLNQATLSRLQKETIADGLLFEVRVLRSRLPEQQAAAATTQGGTI